MKLLLLVALVITFSLLAVSEDVQLRQEADHLLERANAVSSSPNLPNLERSDFFRAFGPGSGAREGSFTRVVIQGTGRREETVFGDYHVVDVWTRKGLATSRTRDLAPAEVDDVMRLTPIRLLSFNEDDIIRAISNRDVNGHAARCIQFDTVTGQTSHNNEICVDAAMGTFVTEKVGDEFIEYRDFFPFAGALMPSKISYSRLGVQKLEISQTMAVVKDPTANVLAAPPDAKIWGRCTTYRPAFGEFMPQPRAGNGGRDSDVIVRGIIDGNGKIFDAVVQSSERPEVEAEALSLIRKWTFAPALCDGHPTVIEASFTLHFQGR